MPVEAMRPAVRQVAESHAPEHPGLALTRYASMLDDNNQAALKLFDDIERLPAPAVYQGAYRRWMETPPPGASRFTGVLQTPMAIGLGGASPLETGLTLHHTYGVPFIPGSALKGLCLRGARQMEAEGSLTVEQRQVLFGDIHSAAFVQTHDAWLVPLPGIFGQGASPIFQRDVITVHHPEYYRAKGDCWPTDFDDPVPIPFLVVRPGCHFLFTLQAPDEPWAGFVARLLKWGLERLGVGGKTNAGYGFFDGGQWKDLDIFRPVTMQPVIEEVWENCVLHSTTQSGATTARGTSASGEFVIEPAQWPAFVRQLSDVQKKAAKKGNLHVWVRVRRQGDKVEVLELLEAQ